MEENHYDQRDKLDKIMETRKPTTLDYILAFIPIPIISEVKATKVIEWNQYEEYGNSPVGIDRDEDFGKNFFASRVMAYALIPIAIEVLVAFGYSLFDEYFLK